MLATARPSYWTISSLYLFVLVRSPRLKIYGNGALEMYKLQSACVCLSAQISHKSHSKLTPKFTAKFERDHPLRGRQMHIGWVKIGHFRRKTHYNSKTVQDRLIVSIKVE